MSSATCIDDDLISSERKHLGEWIFNLKLFLCPHYHYTLCHIARIGLHPYDL